MCGEPKVISQLKKENYRWNVVNVLLIFILKYRVGDWGQMNDRHMSKPGHNNPKTMWPRDYLVRPIRLAEYQIEIAFKHKNRQIFARGKYFPI